MSIDISRSIHPDLLEEYQQQMHDAAGTPADAPARRRRRGRAAADDSPPGDVQPAAEADGSGEVANSSPESTEPSWQQSLAETDDPIEKMALLLKNVPREEMERNDTLRGWLGDYANQRARRMLEDQERQRTEQARQEAYDKGDLYTLGQLNAAELQQQREALQRQQETDNNIYMLGVRQFQASLPEEVQRSVQGRTYPDFPSYLRAVQEAAIRHGVQDEIGKRTAGLDKAALSQTVGMEQSPELDGGPAQAYREITDAQVAAMTLEEYDRHFDERGRPRPGVRVRLERGIDLRQR